MNLLRTLKTFFNKYLKIIFLINDCFIFEKTAKQLTTHRKTLEYAQQLDQEDPLSYLREKFHIPKDKQGNEWLYFTGNSLGLQPKLTKKYIAQELDDWAALGVEGHLEARSPWLSYHEFLTDNFLNSIS